MAQYLQDPVLDSYWKNRAGMGTIADRSRATGFVTEFLAEADLADLYAQDGLFASAISMKVEDGLRGGFIINPGDAQSATGLEGTNSIQDTCDCWVADHNIIELLTQYFTQKPLFGGSVMLQISDVDQSLPRTTDEPDPESRFMAFAPSEMTAQSEFILDPTAPMYGFPLRWNLVGKTYDISWTRPIHTQRLYSTLYRQSSQGYSWIGPSEAYRFLTRIQYWGLTVQAAVSALQMLSQRILKTPRLRAVQTGSESGVVNFIETRLQDINARASNQQAVVIDDSEDLLIAQSSITGMESVMDRLMVSVAADARIPVTRLFGVSPGGFGTGESELKVYYDSVRVWQQRELAPAIRWMLRRKFPGSENWQIEFPPLDAPSQAELIAMRLQQQQIDAGYIGTGVLSADEVANSRFGAAAYSHETTLDTEARAEVAEALELDPETTSDDPNSPTTRPESDNPAPGTSPETDDET
jgi:phage-related protein (TIGR01555 family)